MIAAEARGPWNIPSARRLATAVVCSAVLGVCLGLISAWLAYAYFDPRQEWADPPLLEIWMVTGISGGLAGGLLVLPARLLPVTCGAVIAVVLAGTAFLLPLAVAGVTGGSGLGNYWVGNVVDAAAGSTRNVALFAPVALGLAAIWMFSTLWLTTGSIRLSLDRPSRNRDKRSAAIVMGCAGAAVAVGWVCWFFYLTSGLGMD
jgi:hypothetical protein